MSVAYLRSAEIVDQWDVNERFERETAADRLPGEEDLTTVFSFLGDEPAAPPRELIRGLLPAHGVAITGGQSTAGKTFVEIHKAICLAAPLPFLAT